MSNTKGLQHPIPRALVWMCTALALLAGCEQHVKEEQKYPQLTESGLGAIGDTNVFAIETLRKSYPNLTWTLLQKETEAGDHELIKASHDAVVLFEIAPASGGGVSTIVVLSDKIPNAFGPVVGDAYGALTRDGKIQACARGLEQLSGAIVCPATGSERISYVLRGPWNGADDVMPPAADLASWTIEQIVWRSKQRGPSTVPTSPSFNCAQASNNIEKLICHDTELTELDRRLAATFARVLHNTPAAERKRLQALQRGWIKGRDDCWKASGVSQRTCVKQVYEARIEKLSSRSASGGNHAGTKSNNTVRKPTHLQIHHFNKAATASSSSGSIEPVVAYFSML